MDKYKAFCLDLDGTVYRGNQAIPEAVAFIDKLQKKGTDPFYITNNSSMTQAQLQKKLSLFGIKTDQEHIMTSAIAAAKYCKKNFNGLSVMMIGEKGLEEALEMEEIFVTRTSPDVVIMGIDREISYAKLEDACLAIRAGAHFIATNSDGAFPTERGLVPGNGSFVRLMETATGKIPMFVGKPEPHMLGFIQAGNGFRKDEMVMIGDNYETDILAGIYFGIDTIHVEGGVTSREEVIMKEVQPTYQLSALM